MLLPDTNLLVYAFREDVPEHADAREWLSGLITGPLPVAVTSATLVGFVRVVTHPRVFTNPSPIEAATAFVESMLSAHSVVRTEPGPRHAPIFGELCRTTNAVGNDVPDAHLAALAIESGSELATHDRGFARFPGLRVTDPLA